MPITRRARPLRTRIDQDPNQTMRFASDESSDAIAAVAGVFPPHLVIKDRCIRDVLTASLFLLT